MKKNSFSLSLKNITILAGVCVILLSVSIYAGNQSKKSYRSVNATTTVGYENNAGSFNANKIEEHGDCKIVTANTCGKDVFIPTNTSPERTAFKDNHPACIILADCPNSCVLKEFMEWVYAGTTTHSKVRNAVNGRTNDYQTGSSYSWFATDNFVIGYGLDFAIALTTGYDGRPKIVSSEYVAAIGQNNDLGNYSWFDLYEFELYGITPETENTNRGCFDDGSYWVNSNVYSRQTVKYISTSYATGSAYSWSFTTTRFWWISWVNLWLFTYSNRPVWYVSFAGCKSEFLPNPDKYCVERLIPQTWTSINKPAMIYLKEFTNNADYTYAWCSGSGTACLSQRDAICSNLTNLGNNASFNILSTGQIDPLLLEGTVPASSPYLYNMFVPALLDTSPENTGLIYRNTTWSRYGTQIFGYWKHQNDFVFHPRMALGYINMNNINNNWYYNYNEWYYTYQPYDFIDVLGSNTLVYNWSSIWYNQNRISNYRGYAVKIPLQETGAYLKITDRWSWFPPLYYISIPWGLYESSTFYNDTITKYVCVSYTCGPCYTAMDNWCVHNNTPACNGALDDDTTTPTTPIWWWAWLWG